MFTVTIQSEAARSSLPSIIANKKACINIKNNDEKCFLYSVIAHQDPPKHHLEKLCWKSR